MDCVIYQEFIDDHVWREALRLCVESIRTHSPASKIIIIGKGVRDFEFVPEDNFLQQYNQFLPHYVHMSPNGVDFELRSIRRWFVINEYVQTIEMDQFIHIDSDVLCFCDFHKLLDEIKKSDIWSPHASFTGVFDRHGLAMFCKAILWIYQHKESKAWKTMSARYTGRNSCTGVSDMNLMDWFMSTRKHLSLCNPAERGDIVDANICLPQGLLADGDRKRLFFLDGLVYGVAANERVVRMNTLHCWGPYKRKMRKIWERSRQSVGNPNPMPFTEQTQKKTSRFRFW